MKMHSQESSRNRHLAGRNSASPMLAWLLGIGCLLSMSAPASGQWTRHVIDDSSQGADGVRLADVNGDGLADVTTGWEEGGLIRVYLNPGYAAASQRWPAVTVGKVASPEDAVLVDLDRDGAVDVVSCCEGDNMTVFVHWAPQDPVDYRDESKWQTEAFEVTREKTRWMYCLPMEIDGKNGIDLIVGSKNPNGVVGWLECPKQPRDLAAWKFHKLRDAGWIMSIEPFDMDRDNDLDVVISDRKGDRRGVYWLENPGVVRTGKGQPWNCHAVGGRDMEVMFLDIVAEKRVFVDQPSDTIAIVTATRNGHILVNICLESGLPASTAENFDSFHTTEIGNSFGVLHGKSVRVGDINLDGQLDMVLATNKGDARDKPGLTWKNFNGSTSVFEWEVHDISGKRGIKFDLIKLLDVDGDQDLDVLTCEERDNLGVIWYENPTR